MYVEGKISTRPFYSIDGLQCLEATIRSNYISVIERSHYDMNLVTMTASVATDPVETIDYITFRLATHYMTK